MIWELKLAGGNEGRLSSGCPSVKSNSQSKREERAETAEGKEKNVKVMPGARSWRASKIIQDLRN